MEQYIVSARKYRPQTFESVIGQSSLTATLKNAIVNKHLAHAYLFCGPRGVGKTTCARIFAKAINCLNPREDGEACNECESCRAFNEQRSLNIHELDAASNNSVNDIRSLIEQVQILPQTGKYSVYIIDEVHMLSSGAFNAFLKTLEEPPAHAIFILATTEKHKIIPTVLSRCQIYDFNRIRIDDTVKYLKYVSKNEGVQAEDMALNVIAHKADGAMRDALSIFDQVVSCCGQNLTYQDVINNLNVLDYDYYFRLVDSLLAGDVTKALLIFDDILSKGFDGMHFIDGFASHLRDIMVSKDADTISLLEVGESIAHKYKEQAQKCDNTWIYRALELTNEATLTYKESRNQRLHIEVLMIRLAGMADGGIQLKKVEPELPLIAVAPTPVLQNTHQATAPQETTLPQTGNIDSIKNDNSRPAIALPKINNATVVRLNVVRTADDKAPKGAKNISPTSQTIEKTDINETNDFSEEDMQRLWKEYAKSLEKEAYITNAMLNFLPHKVDDSTLELTGANTIQVEAISNHKHKIETFLAKKLRNNKIKLNIVLDETKDNKEAFTPEEKFKKMQEMNPNIKYLKTKLGLELL